MYQTLTACKHCDKFLPSAVDMRNHCFKDCPNQISKHYQCDLCPKLFLTKFSLERHMVSHNQNIDAFKHLTCKKCHTRLFTRTRFLRHINHPGRKCYACDEKFSCPKLMRNHKKEHQIGKMFHCTKCNYKGKSKQNLYEHMKIHFKKFSCKLCDKKFPTSNKLNEHVKYTHHNEIKKFKCEICGHSFFKKHRLITHQNFSHLHEEMKCEICSKICQNKLRLNKHKRIHMKVKCKICKKDLSKSNLYRHYNSKHRGLVYECDRCGRKFVSKELVVSHMKNYPENFHYPCRRRTKQTDYQMLVKKYFGI
jgi:KRAB domain-containing zinc finger protein